VAFSGRDERVPHVYDRSTDPLPYLYYANGREWRSDKPWATTVLPRLLGCLRSDEFWLASGVWFREGIEHGMVKRAHA
jgi:hypothetical protein